MNTLVGALKNAFWTWVLVMEFAIGFMLIAYGKAAWWVFFIVR
jgi:hypothetical protein